MRMILRGFALLVTICCLLPSFGSRMDSTAKHTQEVAVSAGNGGTVRFLVLGRDRAAGLTDSIFVVSVDTQQKQASVLQIPRDTYANYTKRDYKKLNGALSVLGATELKRSLSEALGVKLHYFVILDLSTLHGVVDAIGGVDVNIPQDLIYEDPAQGLSICLRAGENHLDGAGAEQLVRFRSGYPDADLGRLDAQKLFLRAFAIKCKNLTVRQLGAVICRTLTTLQTDVSLPEAIRAVTALRACDAENFPMATLVGKAVQGSSGAWYYCVNRAGGARMANEYLMPQIPLNMDEFDPNGFFDRIENEKFHKIYIAPDLLA